jgi:hypothetical protein
MSVQRQHRALKRASVRQEKRLAESVGGRTQPGSGSRTGHKSDVRLFDRLRIEAKLTTKDSYRLALKDLSKIRGECTGRERPVFVVEFKDPQTLMTRDAWALIPLKDWERLQALDEKNDDDATDEDR